MPETLNVLIADDDDLDRLMTRRMLSQLEREITIEEVTTCVAAFDAMTTRSYDCVLLDFQFPDGNGLNLLRDVRAAGIRTPIIVLTGHGDELVAVELLQVGASGYISKSTISSDRLLQSLTNVRRTYEAETRALEIYEALCDSEARYRTMIEQSPLSVQIFTPNGECIEANRAWEELWGASRADVMGYRILEDPQVGVSDALLLFERAFAGEILTIPALYYDPAASGHPGRPRWVQMTLYPIKDDNEAIREIVMLHQDVTEQRQSEERLRASENRFRWISDSNVIGVLFWDLDGRITDANDAFLSMVGYTREDLTSGALNWKILTPEEYHDRDTHALSELEQHGVSSQFEKEYIRKDGSRVAVLIGASRLDGSDSQGLAFVLDITESRKVREELENSEQSYRFMTEVIPQIVWTALPDGGLDFCNQRWYEYSQMTRAETMGAGWVSSLYPDDVPRAVERWTVSLQTGTTYEIEFRIRRGSDRTYRWHLVRAMPLSDADGQIVKWFGSCTDIDDQKRNEEAQRFLSEASTILGASLEYQTTLRNVALLAVPSIADWCAVDLLDEDGTVRRVATTHANPDKIEMARRLQERYPEDPNSPSGLREVLRSGQSQMVSVLSDEMLVAAARDAEHLKLIRELGLRSYLCVPLIARGRTIGAVTLVCAENGRLYGPSDLILAEELARRAALAVDNSRLFFEAKARADRETLVNAIGKKLRSSLDADEILQTATREVGEALGVSRCLWAWLIPQNDAFEVNETQYTAAGVERMLGQFPVSGIPTETMARMSAGQPLVVADWEQDAEIQRYAVERGRPLQYRSFIHMPIFVRGALAGIMAVHEIEHPRLWNSGEVELLTSVADVLGLALENARLYAREHRVADMLQSAFLSDIPDQLADLTLGTLYRAGLEESHVGGDYYDAFLLPDGRVALVMADVSGKGLSAAVQTATVKYSLRAFAAEAAAPSLVLTRLNRMLRSDAGSLGDHFVTLFYAVYDPASGRLTYCSAGHETLIIKRLRGTATLLVANGPILGITEHRYSQITDRLEPGDTLVMYTDGLTEARSQTKRELMEVERVVEALQRVPVTMRSGAIAVMLERLALDWSSNRPHDDMAFLVAQRQMGESTLISDEIEATESLFTFEFASVSDCAAEVRQALAYWMPTLGFDLNAIENFQTAVTEAVTNAVRHGSPNGSRDQIRILGSRTSDGELVVEVEDNGPGLGRNYVSLPMPHPEAPGGRGLPLMYELSDVVEYVSIDAKHRVRLILRRREG